jgi:hypothetical protein
MCMAGVETLVATIHHLPCQLAKFVLTFILFVIRESDSSGDLRLEDRVKAHLLVVNARCKALQRQKLEWTTLTINHAFQPKGLIM